MYANLIIHDRIILWIIIKEAMAETEVTKRGLNCRIHSKVSLGPINWAKPILESLCIQKDVKSNTKAFRHNANSSAKSAAWDLPGNQNEW